MKVRLTKKPGVKAGVLLAAFITSSLLILDVYDKTNASEADQCVLSIIKFVDRDKAEPGSTLTYTLDFSNTGTADCTGGGVRVWDVVSDKLNYVSETHSDNVSAGSGENPLYNESTHTLYWNAHTLTPGESGRVSWTVTVNNPSECGNFDIINSGNITSYEYNNFQDVVESNEVRTAINNACYVPKCVLNISKEVNKAGAAVEDILTYTLNFSNSGDADCTGGGVKVQDIFDANLIFVDESHSDNVDAGYNGIPLFDEENRTLSWNAHELTPGESGFVRWNARVGSPENCGNFGINNKGSITSWEYSEFNEWVRSNEVRTEISNECPAENDTLIHIIKKSCPSWSVLTGNGDAEVYDDTNGHFTEFVNYSQDEPHFPNIYPNKPVTTAEVPGSCKAQAGWKFKLSTDQAQSENVSETSVTNENGEVSMRLSELAESQRNALTNGGRLWVSEISDDSQEFGQLRCYKDAQFGDNLDYIDFSSDENLPDNAYCIAYNVKLVLPTLGITLTKGAEPESLPQGGGAVGYAYNAANSGDAALSDIVLTDDKCSNINFQGGDTNSDSKLDTSETWNYKCSMNLSETTTNVATVTGKFGDTSVSATASKTVTVASFTPNPSINLAKTANPTTLPVGGGNVKYTYTVTNPGNVRLRDITLTDDKCSAVQYSSGDADSNSKLDTDETWIYSCEKNLTETTTNTAIVTGKYEDATLTKTATATVTVAQFTPAPAIHVSKSPNPTSLGIGGGVVTYSYNITNPGNVVLTDITITDDKCSNVNYTSGDANSDQKLDTNETWKYTCITGISQTTTNTATATGHSGSQIVTGQAQATVSVATDGGGGGGGGGPVIQAIKVTKTPVPATVPAAGADVVYKYAVTDIGSSQLHDVSLTDDKCQDIKYISGDTNNDKWLQVGEVWNYECKSFIKELTVNTATAVGYAGNQKVTASATAKVTVGITSGPTIKLVKKGNPERLGPSGGNVVYSYDITNPGVNPLQDVSLSDNKCSDLKLIGGDANSDNELNSSETWHYECKMNLTATTTNFATARGKVGSVYATDTASFTVTVGKVIVPAIMPKTGGGAAAKEEERNRNFAIILAGMTIGGVSILKTRKS